MERVDYESIVVQDLANLAKVNELDLEPWYQRRSVWTTPQKAYLINSLFQRKPIPTCYIRHYLDLNSEKSIKEIVDGQQRIRSILEYLEDKYTARHPVNKKRLKYSQLSPAERKAFLMTKISIGYLIDADDADVIDIFGRLNSVSKTLNEQEKRNARFSGELKAFCLAQAAKRVQLWRDLRVFTANDIARMSEVQFVSDLAYNLVNGISDYSSERLNKFYAENDESFTQLNAIDERMEKAFLNIAGLDPKAIRDTIFNRQPLFFSLFLVIDALSAKVDKPKLENALYAVDKSFNSDKPVADRTKADAEFYFACTSSTQRIKSRAIRDKYLKAAIAKA